jgi:urease accessory protein
MITVTKILGTASEPSVADRLHHLEHKDSVELLVVDRDDTLRRRLRGKTDKGTDIAIALDRGDRLADGAVLLLEEARAVVLRVTEQRWLRITPQDAGAALEAGYCAGNQHWRVRFEPGALLVAMQGPAEHYLARLKPLLRAGKIEVADDE